jgi:hypothetical protein
MCDNALQLLRCGCLDKESGFVGYEQQELQKNICQPRSPPPPHTADHYGPDLPHFDRVVDPYPGDQNLNLCSLST